MTTSEVGGVRSSTAGARDRDLRDRSGGMSISGAFGAPADELGTTDARFLLESDGLACCMTCGLVTRPWVVRLPDVKGTSAVVARCVACGTRGTVHAASHWVRVTRTAPNPSASIA
ncbi:MAG: hypothetical protein ABJD24_09405 [Acidimicrobiales bacterium]